MRTAAIILALIVIALAVPLVLRLDSGRSRRNGETILDSVRLVVAISAAAVLVLVAARQR